MSAFCADLNLKSVHELTFVLAACVAILRFARDDKRSSGPQDHAQNRYGQQGRSTAGGHFTRRNGPSASASTPAQ